MKHEDITYDIFELAYRRYQDVVGNSCDQWDINWAWSKIKDDPTALEVGKTYAFVKPFLPGGEQYNEWRNGR